MSHVFTLALVHALLLQSAMLLHVAAAGWTATRRLTVEPLTLLGAPLAAALGMALVMDAVTAGTFLAPFGRGPVAIGWLGGIGLLVTALLLHEASRVGWLWRAIAVNAPGLVVIGVPVRIGLALFLGLALAAFAGILAPPPALTDWLPVACLALLVTGAGDRPPGRAVLATLLAWLMGAAIGGLELMLGPVHHALASGLLTLVVAIVILVRHGGGRIARDLGAR